MWDFMHANYPYVTNIFWYEEIDQDGTTHEGSFGLLNVDYSPKPVYTALSSYFASH